MIFVFEIPSELLYYSHFNFTSCDIKFVCIKYSFKYRV